MTKRSRCRRGDTREPWHRQINPWLAASVLLVVVVFAALALSAALRPPAPGDSSGLSTLDDPAKGEADAPVTIVEFSDFQCPACAGFAATVLPVLEANYVETGLVRLVFRDFPLPQHEQSLLAAQAGGCAHEQGLFWEMHDLIFAQQSAWAGQANAGEMFKEYASQTGLDVAAFATCLDSGKYESEVEEDVRAGNLAGVAATPTFFINGTSVRGIPGDFFAIIDGALEAS